MQAKEWTFQVSNAGHLPGQVRLEFDDLVRSLAGKRVTIKLMKYQKKRSLSQNAFYHGAIVPAVTQMFRDAGNYVDEDDTHTYLKLRVGKLSRVIVTPDGEVVKTLGSTAKLSTMEFENYLAMIRAWAAEYGCVLPMPNEEVNQLTEREEP